MTAQQRIRDFLIADASKTYCDDCISTILQIKPRHQVQQKTSALAKEAIFKRAAGRCARCASDKLVIQSSLPGKQDTSPINIALKAFSTAEKPSAKAKSLHTLAEEQSYQSIRMKDRALRSFLHENQLADPTVATQWLAYLTGIKHSLGNINNNISFVATVLVKHFLEQRFSITDFDAGGKAQGAAGIDIEARTSDGKLIAGEVKTTKPYQPGFGAAQRATILKDLARLAASKADHRFMFVVDSDAFITLSRGIFSSQAPGVEVVDLVSGKTFVSPGAP